MPDDNSFQALRENFEANLVEQIRARQEEEGQTLSSAFNRISADWLGYELDDEFFVDGGGDRGIDYWYQHNAGFDIIQTKSHELEGDWSINREMFDGSGISDLQRASTFLRGEEEVMLKNTRLKRLKSKWDFEIRGRVSESESEPLLVNLILIIFGDGLTSQAKQEYASFESLLEQPIEVSGVPVQFQLSLFTLEKLVESRWREENRVWRDKQGKKKKLYPA